MLNDLRTCLRDPALIKEACQRARKSLRTKPSAPAVTPAQVLKVEQEVASLTEAIASGLLKFSPALAQRLQGAEDELADLRAAQARHVPDANIEKLATGLEARFHRLADDFERALLDRHGEKGRQEIRCLLGLFKVESDEREIRIYNEKSRHVAALLRAVGATDARNYGSGGTQPRVIYGVRARGLNASNIRYLTPKRGACGAVTGGGFLLLSQYRRSPIGELFISTRSRREMRKKHRCNRLTKAQVEAAGGCVFWPVDIMGRWLENMQDLYGGDVEREFVRTKGGRRSEWYLVETKRNDDGTFAQRVVGEDEEICWEGCF